MEPNFMLVAGIVLARSSAFGRHDLGRRPNWWKLKAGGAFLASQ
jgi:hypothetical protein